jgi:hypothetical protein
VQRDARSLLEDELAAVDSRLPGEHAQQGGLPGAVAPGERHAVAALELERDAAEQRTARHVLVESASDHHGHVRERLKPPRAGARGGFHLYC